MSKLRPCWASWPLLLTLIPQEHGDELYTAISHSTSDEEDPSSACPTALADNTDHGDHHDGLESTGTTVRDPFAAAEREDDGGYPYAQEEMDQYNAGLGGQHGGAPPLAPSSVCADDASASSSTIATPLPNPGTTPEDPHQLEQHDENYIGHSDATFGDIGGGERQAEVQEGVGGGTNRGELDGHGENNTVTPSSAAEAAATEEGCDADDEVDGGTVGRQEEQQQQLQRGEESDDLYDIDDHGLSSSDDD